MSGNHAVVGIVPWVASGLIWGPVAPGLAGLAIESVEEPAREPPPNQNRLVAQATPPQVPQIPPQDVLPTPAPSPELPEAPPPLPPPEDLLQPSPSSPEAPETVPDVPATITVKQFNVVGSTVFSPEELAAATAPFTNRPITFAELLQARSAVTQLYIDAGYITSGAFIPAGQTLKEEVVTIQVVEGELQTINITGNGRLSSRYIRQRIALAAGKPLNVPQLVEGLQLLQLDPLIETLSAELAAGPRPGQSILDVEIDLADTFDLNVIADNGRSPAVGSFRRQVQLQEANLLGQGDALSLSYINTDGSDEFDVNYTWPFNPRNGTLSFAFQTTSSEVIDPEDFEDLDIESDSNLFELTVRQPLIQDPTQEFALGLTLSRQKTDISWIFEEFGFSPALLSPGAEEDGETRITALRFFQEWVQRGRQEVFALRSQFSVGLDWFDATLNDGDIPDSNFFSWQGQAQWVRLLAPDTLLLLRTNAQVANRPLLALEQFGTGGLGSVRGYRQDQLLTDSGFFASAELRLPIARIRKWDSVLQLTPFIDFGKGWNQGDDPNPEPSNLLSLGIGLRWQVSDRLTARIDWGIPLVDVEFEGNSLQEDGILFSVTANPF